MRITKHIFILIIVFLSFSCRKDKNEPNTTQGFQATPFKIDIPTGFPAMPIPADNPLTVEGIELGRKLFFDTKLSGDNSISCATCHSPQHAFSDPNKFSEGIDGILGNRQSMVIQNLGWGSNFFWDGRAFSLEEQALKPVTNPIEMHETWPNASEKINSEPTYQIAFLMAFGTKTADSTLITKAIAQFMRSLISGNAKYDKWVRGELRLLQKN